MRVVHDYFRIPGLLEDEAAGQELKIPYIQIYGAHDGPHLTLLAGVHGCEYAGMAALRQFISTVEANQLHGTITAIPVVNIPAFVARTPFVVPQDGKNLNRCFPGNLKGTYSDVLAYHIFERFIRPSDYLVDLHSGDVPEVLEPMAIYDESPVGEMAQAMARAYATNHIIRQPSVRRTVGGSTSAAAADASIPAIVAEAGSNGLADDASVNVHLRGLRNLTAFLEMLPYAREDAADQVEHSAGWNWLYTPVGGWWQPMASLAKHVAEGALIGQVSDLFGEVIHEVRAPEAGIPLFITSSPSVASDGLLVALAREV